MLTVLWCGVLASCFCAYALVIRWTSPLAAIPNAHWLAPHTSLWIQWQRFQGREFETISPLIQKKGSIIRLGPKELLVSSYADAIRTIYGGGHPKPSWYNFAIHFGNIFTSLSQDHMIRRRRLTHVFSKSFVQNSRQVCGLLWFQIFLRYLPKLANAADSKSPLPVLTLNTAYALDSVSSYLLGISHATAFLSDKVACDSWLSSFHDYFSMEHTFWLREAPTLADFLRKIGIKVVPPSFYRGHRYLEACVMQMVNKAEKTLQAATSSGSSEPDFPAVYGKFREALTREKYGPSPCKGPYGLFEEQREEIASEILDNLVATNDTFGINISYILWELSTNHDWQTSLRQELRSVQNPLTYPPRNSAETMIAPRQLESLPILCAVVKESLRIRNTKPTPEPRITPHGRKTTLGQYKNIPGGVRTNSYAWHVHRDATVFTDPLKWDPGRWLQPLESRAQMERHFWVFGSGSRMCLGMNLANELMRYLIAGVYTNFRTSIADDRAFAVHSGFVTGVPGEDLTIIFEHVE